MRASVASLRQMAHLEKGWDSYGARPIDQRAIDRAVLMLDSLQGNWQAVPCSDGSVQLELHEGGFDIEITISAVPTDDNHGN